MKRILLTQLRRIGDVITTTPAVRAVRKAWPDAVIDYMTESPSDEIFKYNPYIDNIILIKRKQGFLDFIKTVKMLRKNNYDFVIDFFCNPTSAYLTWLSGAKHRVGFDLHFRKMFYTHIVDTSKFPQHQYAGIHKLALVANIGAMPCGYAPEFFIGEEEQREADETLASLGVKAGERIVTMGVVTRHAFRQWPLENFAMLADMLIDNFGVKILFIYGPGEEAYPEKVASMMKNKPLGLYPPSGIGRMRGLYERAALHVGCDNGPANIAKASCTPSVVLYSNTRASSWTPPEDANNVGMEIEMECKSSCLHEKCPHSKCIRDISVDSVYFEAQKFLQ